MFYFTHVTVYRSSSLCHCLKNTHMRQNQYVSHELCCGVAEPEYQQYYPLVLQIKHPIANKRTSLSSKIFVKSTHCPCGELQLQWQGNLVSEVILGSITESFGLEGTLKIILFQAPCHGQGHLPLDQVAQSPMQPGLEHFQGGGIHSSSGQPVPVPHHPHRKEILPYV